MIDATNALLLSGAAKEASDKAYLEKIRNLTLCRMHTAIAEGRTSIWVDCDYARVRPLVDELTSSGYRIFHMTASFGMYASVKESMEIRWGE